MTAFLHLITTSEILQTGNCLNTVTNSPYLHFIHCWIAFCQFLLNEYVMLCYKSKRSWCQTHQGRSFSSSCYDTSSANWSQKPQYATARREQTMCWSVFTLRFVAASRSLIQTFSFFLRATAYMLSAHMLSQFRPSVRPSICRSVTRVDQSKTVEVRIMQFHRTVAPSL